MKKEAYNDSSYILSIFYAPSNFYELHQLILIMTQNLLSPF